MALEYFSMTWCIGGKVSVKWFLLLQRGPYYGDLAVNNSPKQIALGDPFHGATFGSCKELMLLVAKSTIS